MARPTKDPSTKSYTITVDGIYREWMDAQDNKSVSIRNLIKLALELVGDGDFTEALIKKAASTSAYSEKASQVISNFNEEKVADTTRKKLDDVNQKLSDLQAEREALLNEKADNTTGIDLSILSTKFDK
ncbi:MAG TPA: hypothetical protein K8V14_10270 [Staphylococcus ureilyticus]|uniref:hypothetical protein n=1 Tax=Staphylococcus ureilyticus TaxID=94138 RepID=UPI001D98A6B6|nr:hypothetical protein [Staphylococcus ureilyticus]HJG67691.1 hypothetical protein [Staphylococcus ureilyticus]